MGRLEVLERAPSLRDVWAVAAQHFPVQITRSFWQRLRGDLRGPLARQVLPDPAELLPDVGGLADPVGDAACSPMPWVVHKYPSRVLLLLTKRCHLYCRYCFRRDHEPTGRQDPTPAELDAAVAYVRRARPEEVILSGGDPLAVSDRFLFGLMDRLRSSVPVIRLHTRAPITAPWRVTTALVQGLAQRRPVWVVVHCNHADELSDEVVAALRLLLDAGVPVLNQAVLLAGVNDDVDTLVALSLALVRVGVFPYYLHHPDAAQGTAHFRVSLERGLELHAELATRVSGVALPRYVLDPPEGSGKRDVFRA